ncbi:hypothetical protein V5R04_08830 [Jonesiaceae bacterium BS-20]|uniref:Uncharacterized protein n=1 Tax=Jonesiaceae bacterium BS-20 TaxID=3120821 RepID=A0AAU7DUB6_9MICO
MFNFFKRKPKKTDQTGPQVVQPVLNQGPGIQAIPLQDVGMRLLFIDPDSDMYYFTVVSQTQFGHLNGRRGTDFELKSVTNL